MSIGNFHSLLGSNLLTPPGQVLYAFQSSLSAYSSASEFFTVPTGVYTISVALVGGGGGGASGVNGGELSGGAGGSGGDLVYLNNIPVTPGESLLVTVGHGGFGGDIFDRPDEETGVPGQNGNLSRISRGGVTLASAQGGFGGAHRFKVGNIYYGGQGGASVGGSGAGGSADSFSDATGRGGGGVAGWDSGTGGRGEGSLGPATLGTNGGGNGGSAGLPYGSFGGGTSLISPAFTGGPYGAGGGGGKGKTFSPTSNAFSGIRGQSGAVRIIWGNRLVTREFPSTNTQDYPWYGDSFVEVDP